MFKWSASFASGKMAVRVGHDVIPSTPTAYDFEGGMPTNPTVLGDPAIMHFTSAGWESFTAKMFMRSRRTSYEADTTPFQSKAREIAKSYATLEAFKTSKEAQTLYDSVFVFSLDELRNYSSGSDLIFRHRVSHKHTAQGTSRILVPWSSTIPRKSICKRKTGMGKGSACFVHGHPDCCMIVDTIGGKSVEYPTCAKRTYLEAGQLQTGQCHKFDTESDLLSEQPRRAIPRDPAQSCSVTILTTFITGMVDWQRNVSQPATFQYMKAFYESVRHMVGVHVVVLHDQLPQNVTEKNYGQNRDH